MNSSGQRKNISPVAGFIHDEIARCGIISVARFMELALYHPDHGYYRESHIGKSGDFFTSVSVGPLFGQMLAYFLAKRLADLDGAIHIVEAGANDGSLAADILTWLAHNRPQIAGRLTYFIVEPIAQLQQRQREKLLNLDNTNLQARPQVVWLASLDQLPAIRGAIICNEVLDAFPVHVFRWNKAQAQWREFGVDSSFSLAPMPTLPDWSRERLADLKPLESYLPNDFTVEFGPTAEAWWHSAAGKLESGLMLALDYGDEATTLWSPARTNGTLRSFYDHKLVDSAFENPGEQDITASVNFTRIRAAAERAGLVSEPLQTQAQFLTKIAAEYFSNPAATEIRQFQTLTHPEHLGRAFKVLVQSRTNS